MIRIKLIENDEVEMTDEEFNDFFNEYDLDDDDLILPFEEVKDCIKGITLLSVEEAENLLTEEQRKCTYNGERCCWWLRSPGDDQDAAAFVDIDGSVLYFGYSVNYAYDCVRPALILSNLKSSNLK